MTGYRRCRPPRVRRYKARRDRDLAQRFGYGTIGGSKKAPQKIFDTKRRGSHKRNALLGDSVTQRELHALDSRSQDIVVSITLDFNLPLGVIGPYRPDHPDAYRRKGRAGLGSRPTLPR
jgi:hypothetical protein